jgi:hypothetical protein
MGEGGGRGGVFDEVDSEELEWLLWWWFCWDKEDEEEKIKRDFAKMQIKNLKKLTHTKELNSLIKQKQVLEDRIRKAKGLLWASEPTE